MNWIRNLIRARRMKLDVAEEIESHIEERAAELMELGRPEREARQQARREFGSATLQAELGRDVWSWTWLEQLFQDLRYSLRALRRAPGFTAVAILSLALGIGGNTAVFSLLDGMMLKSLPVAKPEELRILTWVRNNAVPMDSHSGYTTKHPVTGQNVSGSFSYPAYTAFRERVPQFSGVAGFAGARCTVTVNGVTDFGYGEFVTGNYFQTLGAQPLMGRTIAASDDVPAQAAVVVLTHRYWKTRFDGDPSILGKQVMINRRAMAVIGVTRPLFQGVRADRGIDFFLPLSAVDFGEPQYWSRAKADNWFVQAIGRLKPGASEAAASGALTATLAQNIEGYAGSVPAEAKPAVLLSPGGRGVGLGRDRLQTPFYVLSGTVCLVLLIACVNLANLLLARAAARQREMAIRLSIGAGRWRLVRQFFTESLLLSCLGGAAGLLLSAPLTEFLLSHQTHGEPTAFDVGIDGRTLFFTLAVSMIAGLAFGVAPAWRSTRQGLSGGMRAGGAGMTHSRSRLRFHWLLIAAQVAFSLILLVTAGLFMRTLVALGKVDLGFSTAGLLTFQTDASRGGYKGAALATLYERLRRDLAAVPGVESVALSDEGLIQESESDGPVYIPGGSGGGKGHTMVIRCSDTFLSTMKIPVVRGRDLSASDGAGAGNVAIVNESFRKKFLPDTDPVGKIFYRSSGPPNANQKPIEIVGVSRDAHYTSVREVPSPTVYFPYVQRPSGINQVTFAMRTSMPASALAAPVRRVAAAIDPAIPVVEFRTQEEQITRTLGTEHLFAGLVSLFGLLATLLAAIGLYGVLAYAVSRRTAEIGIRLALGATRGTVLWQMIRGSLATVMFGLALGVPTALALTRVTRTLLFGVSESDTLTFVAASAILLAVSVVASWLPARKASRIEPVQALRYD